MRVLFLVAMLMLAGCAKDAPDAAPAATVSVEDAAVNNTTTAPTPLSSIHWGLEGCQFMYTTASGNAAAVQADMPDGFTVDADGDGQVTVGFETNVCNRGTTLKGWTDDQTYATVWVGVTPPDHLVVEDGAFHVMNFEVLVADSDRRVWMQNRGIAAHDGTIDIHNNLETQIINLELNDLPYVFTIGGLQAVPNGGGTFDQWTPGDKLTYWRTDWTTTQQWQGLGTVQIPQGSLYSSWFDTSLIQAQFNVGTWDYTDGRIEYPAPTHP